MGTKFKNRDGCRLGWLDVSGQLVHGVLLLCNRPQRFWFKWFPVHMLWVRTGLFGFRKSKTTVSVLSQCRSTIANTTLGVNGGLRFLLERRSEF